MAEEPDGVVVADVPVDAIDVTRSDGSLRSTANEVTVLVQDGLGTPTVTKLRAESPEAAERVIKALDSRPGVVAAPTVRLRAFEGPATPEPLGPKQWNLPMVGAPAAWATSQGKGIVVAVIDTGVDGTHPDLLGQVLPEIDLLPEITPDAVANAHGTAVASIIAGALNSSGMAGVAPQARILPVAALDPAGVGDSSTVARAIIAAADAGVRVINLSLGGPDRDPVLDAACVYAYTKGAVLVAAAGNSHVEGNAIQYPAASPNVVAVSAVDKAGRVTSFSNTGRHIDLAAPGQDVLVAAPGGTHQVDWGTSFAAPHVAAAMALVAAANPGLNSAQIVSAIQLTAQDDASGNGRDNRFGFGIVRADRAVTAALSMAPVGLPATSRLRLRKFNAAPEPVRRGRVARFTVRVQAQFPDGVWRATPVPTLVRYEFRAKGQKRFRVVGDVASTPDGTAVLLSAPKQTGTWRAKVRQASGRWTTSRVDHLKVRR
jgi:type VII secretion-associated serine protease mycosin